ncbi:MAG TPA: alpha/beta fold hydrolase [Candidatus Cybelea sp.]|nr:alpha/beta fold hydrolase [Candidatus Cybelea sp.]
MSSRAVLPLLKSGSLPWRRDLAPAANELHHALAAVAPERFAAAVDVELRSRADVFLRGVERYRHHNYRRNLPEPPVLWQEGTTRLLDYGPPGGAPLLVVPSLVNRAYILDLSAEKSLLRHLSAAGARPLLVDWGRPGEIERGFTLTDYIAGRLEAAADAAAAVAGAPFAVIGYCMGGLLALALAQRRSALVRALALLATPWDFHAERAGHAQLVGGLAEPLTRVFGALGEIPVDVLQSLFAALDPLLALRKFTRFAGLPADSAEERDFVALEDWLNDGVPLSLPVARECLAGWYAANTPRRGTWRVAGSPILPRRVTVPSLVVVPGQDRIVPPATAVALADALPAAKRLSPPLGHIGMMVARDAPKAVWQPLVEWLAAHGSSATGSKSRRRRLSKGK